MIQLISPEDRTLFSILTDVQREFLARQALGEHQSEDDYGWIEETYGADFGGDYAGNPDEVNLTAPAYLTFRWHSDVPSHLVISRSASFDTPTERYPGDPEAAEIVCRGADGDRYEAEAGNFLSRTVYFWKVVADDCREESEVRSFTTADDYPRTVFAQGSANIRDLGGLPTFDGKRIRQGILYRGGALESNVDRHYLLTERGKRVLRDILKIRCELELRREAIGINFESAIDPSVRYVQITGRGYDLFFSEEWRENCRKFIEFFADENNYPIYFHCVAGADRTGTLAMYLETLLGVPRKYIELDYNFTSLTLTDKRAIGKTSNYDDFLVGYSGGCIERYAQTQAERFYVEKCGGDPETLCRLRRNLLEDVVETAGDAI